MFKLIQPAYDNLYDWKSSQEKGANGEGADVQGDRDKAADKGQQERLALN